MKIGSKFHGSRIKWISNKSKKITKFQAFIQSNIGDLLNYFMLLIGIFLFSIKSLLPNKEFLLSLLFLGFGVANVYSNTIDLYKEHHSTYGYTKEFIFVKNEINENLRIIPHQEIYEIEYQKVDREIYNISFYTYHIGFFNRSLNRAKIETFKNVKITLKEIKYLQSRIK